MVTPDLTERFDVVLEGTTLPGHDPAIAKAKLAALIRRDAEYVNRLLSGQPTKVKSGIDAASAVRYVEALQRSGVAVHLEPETLDIDADVAPPAMVADSQHTRPTAQSGPSGVAVTPAPEAASPKDFYRAALGPKNEGYFLEFFAREVAAGKRLPSWNWPMFLTGGTWLLYRKMYGWFILLWVGGTAADILYKTHAELESFILAGSGLVAMTVFANSMYHSSIKKKIAVARSLDLVRRQGGVNMWVPWVSGGIFVLGILAAIALPAYLNYSKRTSTPVYEPSDVEPDTPSPKAKASILDGIVCADGKIYRYPDGSPAGCPE